MNVRFLHLILVVGLVIGLALAASAPSSIAFGQQEPPATPDPVVSPASQTVPAPLTGISAIAGGGNHTCAVTTGGGVKCWGHNGNGQLGDNSTTEHHTPVDVSGLSSGVKAIGAGYFHTCALRVDGGVKCWGRNSYGQLGDNSTTEHHTPVDVFGLASGVKAVTVGGFHTCALTTVGGVKCWGYNSYGQLGDGTDDDHHAPADVSGLTNGVKAIGAGLVHTCALTTVGGVKCWGYNGYGQLGDGTITDHHTPADVSTLSSGVKAIALGGNHTCALTTGGGVKCWGNNPDGRLGDGSTTRRNKPVNVSGLTSGVKVIDLGGSHTCAATEGGGVKCWGSNWAGKLGDGTTTDRHKPVDAIGLVDWIDAVAASGFHTCALTTGGGVKCWGHNGNGRLGDGTTINRSIPGDVITNMTCYELLPSHTGGGSNPVAEPGRTHGCPVNHYLPGQNIALFADANAGWRVNGWNGTMDNGSLNQVNSLTMPASDKSVSVTYARCRALTCIHSGSGGDPVPAPARSFNCPAGTYVAGQTIALIAKPNANQRVKKWTGTDTNPGTGVLVNTLTMPGSERTVKAVYEVCYALSAQVSGQGDPLTAIPAASTGCAAGRYVGGQSIALTAAPASGWAVAGWSGTNDNGSTAVANTVVMPAGDHVVGVVYAQQKERLFLPALRR